MELILVNFTVDQNKAILAPNYSIDTSALENIDIGKKVQKNKPAVNIQNFTDQRKSNFTINTIRDITPNGDIQGLLVDGKYLNKDQVEAEIEKLTTQMNSCGTGILGKKMRENLQGKISELQKKLS